jgi:predicted LPLAT superfamily acyltransferase
MAASADPATATSRSWTRLSERGSIWGMRFTVGCYRVLGRRLALGVVHLVVTYFYLTDRAGRRASRAYLRRVHRTREGSASLGRSPDWIAGFLHYRAFALSIADRIELWLGRREDFHFDVTGSEVCDRFAAEGRGYIVLGAHLGSFDALRLLAERQQRCVNVLMFTEHAERINRVFRELSPDVEARVIPVVPGSVHTIFEIRERLERGELVAVLGDRIEPGDRGRASVVPLFGDPVSLPQSPILMAGLIGCPIVFMAALRTGDRRYCVTAELLADRVELPRRERDERVDELLRAFAGCLERLCVQFPLQWFNFFDYWGDAELPPGEASGMRHQVSGAGEGH